MDDKELPKKRGRRKKIVDTDTKPVKKQQKKTIDINTLTNDTFTKKNVNIILNLKCSLSQIDNYLREQKWKTDNLKYDPNVPYDFIPYDNNSNNIELHLLNSPKKENDTTSQIICSKCEQKFDKTKPVKNDELSEDDFQKLRDLKLSFYKNHVPTAWF